MKTAREIAESLKSGRCTSEPLMYAYQCSHCIERAIQEAVAAARAEEREKLRASSLAWRGVEEDDLCPECDGAGSKMYGSTATWRGGIGGQACTRDVCSKCWGSGSKSKPWVSHRLLMTRAEAFEEAANAIEDFAKNGCPLTRKCRECPCDSKTDTYCAAEVVRSRAKDGGR